MRNRDELTNPDSCLSKARDDAARDSIFRASPKPVLSLDACRLFYAIVNYVRRYETLYRNDPASLRNAASDVMDGWKLGRDPEVAELIRRRIIRKVESTWILTEYGCGLVCPSNLAVAGGRK